MDLNLVYILKEIRNSCAHGAMIYRFSKSHRISTVNVQAGINEFHLSQSAINYMDTLKVLSFFRQTVKSEQLK